MTNQERIDLYKCRERRLAANQAAIEVSICELQKMIKTRMRRREQIIECRKFYDSEILNLQIDNLEQHVNQIEQTGRGK